MTGLNVPNKPGVYTLVIELASTTTLTVGSLGVHRFPAGYYTYTGSALGKRSMNLRRRIQRHLVRGKRKHWHIDYLLDADAACVKMALFVETVEDIECEIAQAVARLASAERPVKGFGSSDCQSGCKAHLCCFQETSYSQLVERLTALYRRVGSPQKGVEYSSCCFGVEDLSHTKVRPSSVFIRCGRIAKSTRPPFFIESSR